MTTVYNPKVTANFQGAGSAGASGSNIPEPPPIPPEPDDPFIEDYEKNLANVFTRVLNGNTIFPPSPSAPEFGVFTQPSEATTGLAVNNVNEADLTPFPEDERNITVGNQTFDRFLFQGVIRVKAPNVTFTNCLFDHGGFYGIDTNFTGDGQLNTVVEDCEFRTVTSAAIFGPNWTARRCFVHNVGGDAFKPVTNCLVESNYLTRLGYIDTAHADGNQFVNGGESVIRGNYFDMIPNETDGVDVFKNSQLLIASTNVGTISRIQFYQNWCRGGIVAVQIRDKGNGFLSPFNCVVARNIFFRDTWTSAPFLVDNIGNIFGQNQVYENVDEFGIPLEGQGEPPQL